MTNIVKEVYGQFAAWEDEKEPGVRWFGFVYRLHPNEDNTRVVVEGSDLEFEDMEDFERWFDAEREISFNSIVTDSLERIPGRSPQLQSCIDLHNYTRTEDGEMPSMTFMVRVPFRVVTQPGPDDGHVIPGPWKEESE